MPDLLTAKDVEVRAFKKVSFGGYAIPEVEEFLNQVADDIETYVMAPSSREVPFCFSSYVSLDRKSVV